MRFGNSAYVCVCRVNSAKYLRQDSRADGSNGAYTEQGQHGTAQDLDNE